MTALLLSALLAVAWMWREKSLTVLLFLLPALAPALLVQQLHQLAPDVLQLWHQAGEVRSQWTEGGVGWHRLWVAGNPGSAYAAVLLSPLHLLSGGSLVAAVVLLATVSGWLRHALWRHCAPLARFPRLVFFAAFSLPSWVFWTSLPSKEALLFTLLGLAWWVWLQWGRRWWVWLVIGLLVALALPVRYFFGVYLLGFAALWVVGLQWRRWSFWPRLAVLAACAGAAALVAGVFPVLSPQWLPEVLALSNERTLAHSSQAAGLPGLAIEGDWLSIARHVPAAFLVGVFGPLPWHLPGFFGFVVGVETLFLAGLVPANGWNMPWAYRPSWRWMVLLAMLFLVVLTLASPNWGSLVRYRLLVWLPLLFAAVQLRHR